MDSNEEIAMGHLIRCMAIAEQLKEAPLFICSDSTTESILKEAGYQCVCLNNRYDEKNQEIEQVVMLVDEMKLGALLVDSYMITEHYLRILHSKLPVAYIDDLNQFYYDVDVIINYTYKTKRQIYDKWDYLDTEFLLGSKYIPLRRQFAQKPISIGEVKQLFLTTGGTDGHHVIIDLIKRLCNTDYIINIVLGKYYCDFDDLKQYIEGKKNIVVYRNVPEIAQIMKKSDIAISAGGTTLAELATLGIPTICFSMADNQLIGSRMYAKDGLMVYAGDIRENKGMVLDKIVAEITGLSLNTEKRMKMVKAMLSNFDGNGAARIALKLESMEKCRKG